MSFLGFFLFTPANTIFVLNSCGKNQARPKVLGQGSLSLYSEIGNHKLSNFKESFFLLVEGLNFSSIV